MYYRHYINAALIDKAHELFPTVIDDGDSVRIYPTDWVFETPVVVFNTRELKAVIREELEARAFEDYMLDGAMYDGKYNEYLK